MAHCKLLEARERKSLTADAERSILVAPIRKHIALDFG
jgi:hypothetical protein